MAGKCCVRGLVLQHHGSEIHDWTMVSVQAYLTVNEEAGLLGRVS